MANDLGAVAKTEGASHRLSVLGRTDLVGKVSVSLPEADGEPRLRLSVLWPGSAFGEVAVLDPESRSADVVADTAVRCLVLKMETLRNLPAEQAGVVQLKLTQGLARLLARRLRRVNREFRALA